MAVNAQWTAVVTELATTGASASHTKAVILIAPALPKAVK
jgi:hypothetical protein